MNILYMNLASYSNKIKLHCTCLNQNKRTLGLTKNY